MFLAEKETIKRDITKIKKPKILVIGDVAIDEMIYGDTERISREAPVLILRHTKTKIILGAASNAAHNISTLNGGKVSVIGTYGEDYYGSVLLQAFKDAKVDTSYMVLAPERPTTVKTRISGSCSQSVTQQIVRIDRQTTENLSKETEDKVCKNIEKAIPDFDGVILSDYHLGTLTDKVIKTAIKTAKKYNKVIVADVQKDMARYKGVTAMTPNQPDTEKFVGFFIKDEKSLEKAGKKLIHDADSELMLITRGGDGMAVFSKDGTYDVIPVFNKTDVFDVTGAGDTVVASFTLGLAAGLTPKNSAIIGNLAASIVIRSFGCATTNIKELIKTADKINFEKFRG
ncbi:MAG: bifunctional hydroxymethylpyrimidine kinase/phosphomethylpyrimidine kinase [Candidatus Gastranaerophilales bacterium]|nr:bifunctional hydroxymethylpyrimidine kinase/phosphomethylpyrimidine kinase [Candidatus Gastranaerophilales bacterium]